MQYHLARARGVDESQITRELSGERPAQLARAEAQLLALARHPRTSPAPWLYYMHMRVQEETEAHPPGDPCRRLDDLCDRLVEETTRATLAQLRHRAQRSRVTLDALEVAVGDAGSRTLEILHLIPLIRTTLS